MVAGVVLLLAPQSVVANDSDASVAVGGVVLTREPRISMESERLTISLSKITVEYEFLNDSGKDITTEVAFPIPPYEVTEHAGGVRDFDDFKVWVDGNKVKYQVEAKAFLVRRDDQGRQVGKARDVTVILQGSKIDIPSLGHWIESHDEVSPDFQRLPRDVQKRLIHEGLFDEGGRPDDWQVRKTYFWKQTFPAHKLLRVRHEYSPGFGFGGIGLGVFDQASRNKLIDDEKKAGGYASTQADVDLLRDACLDPEMQKAIFVKGSAGFKPGEWGYVQSSWVDYILTTANSWKTPIKKFELVVERGPKQDMGWYRDDWDYASFCWDGPVTRVDAHHFEASAPDFVPRRELKVLFLTMVATDAAAGGSTGSASRNVSRRWVWVGSVAVVLILGGWIGWRRVQAG